MQRFGICKDKGFLSILRQELTMTNQTLHNRFRLSASNKKPVYLIMRGTKASGKINIC
jgi:hypothetical protein